VSPGLTRESYVENRHIDHIPARERHGQPWHQFAFMFPAMLLINVGYLGQAGVTHTSYNFAHAR
jgi:hypothetical protein